MIELKYKFSLRTIFNSLVPVPDATVQAAAAFLPERAGGGGGAAGRGGHHGGGAGLGGGGENQPDRAGHHLPQAADGQSVTIFTHLPFLSPLKHSLGTTLSSVIRI